MVDGFAVALRFALYCDLMLLFGVSVFGLYIDAPIEYRNVLERRSLSRRLLFSLAVAGGARSGVSLVQLAATMSAVRVAEIDYETLRFISAIQRSASR